jgi:tetratricopeptide (TPR) repeat protein
MRRYEEARAELVRTLDLEPNYYPAHLYLARVALLQGLMEEAITEFKKASDMSGDQITIVAELAHAYATAERQTESLALLNQLLDEAEKHFVPNYYLALIWAGLRDHDRAFDFLAKACDVKEVQLGLWFRREPRFDVLREDPRYQTVLKRMNLV